MLIFQVICNIGMCLFVMPVIGLTLPFFSYGGTALILQLAEMGIVLNISRTRYHVGKKRQRSTAAEGELQETGAMQQQEGIA